jgi:hypothetical protein
MNAYSLQELQTAAYMSRLQNFSAGGRTVLANESRARAMGYKTIFLSHSHKDRDYALGLKSIIESQGGNLYIDWLDEEMPAVTSKETAERLRVKIVQCYLFMFLATPNSMTSRWCPWEIGYADGKKGPDNIVIVPTKDNAGTFYGSEYLHLYRRIEPSSFRTFSSQPPSPEVIRPGQYSGVPVQQL